MNRKFYILVTLMLLFSFPLRSQVFVNLGFNSSYGKTSIDHLTADQEGNVWMLNSNFLLKYDGVGWEIIEKPDSLQDYNSSLAVDYDGNVWMGGGCMNDGCLNFDGASWMIFESRYGPEPSGVNAIKMDLEGNVWFGGEPQYFEMFRSSVKLSSYDGKNWTNHLGSTMPGNFEISSIAVDKFGRKWSGLVNGNVALFDDSNWTYYAEEQGLLGNEVFVISMHPGGDVWIGTTHGISVLDGEDWSYFTESDGLVENHVEEIAFDSTGNVWISYGKDNDRSGLTMTDGSNWTSYTVKDGLISNTVHDIEVDHAGRVWIATAEGLSVVSDDKISIIDTVFEGCHIILKTEREHHKRLKIYPNPCRLGFTIDLETQMRGGIEVRNLNGQLIKSRPITSTYEQIDLSSYAKGIYFVTVRSDAWVRTEKVVRY